MTASTTAIERTDDSKPFQEMDVLDEQQITEELKGHILESYFYEVQGRPGLSYAGIKAVAARYAAQGHPISVEHVEIVASEDGLSFRAIAVAKDLTTGEKRTGAAEVERWMDSDMKKPKPFAYTMAGSKAQRNAIRHFLPESVIEAAYKEFREKKKGGAVKAQDVTIESRIVNSLSRDEIAFSLKDFEGVEVTQQGDEVQVSVAAKKLLDKEFMDKLKSVLLPLAPVWIGKTKERAAYYSVKVK